MADWTRRKTISSLAAVGLVGCKTADPSTADTDPAVPTDTDAHTGLTDTSVFDTGPFDTDPPDPVCVDPTGGSVEGPFYPGEPAVRMDIREDRDGIQIDLDLEIVAQGTCDPLVGAEVDVWAADATGAYSGYPTFGTEGESWLRGQQVTDDDGIVRFTAIVPGAYPGRAVHFHVKVRAAGLPELTTQVYLPDAIVVEALADVRYDASAPITPNAVDNFYADDALMTVTGSAVPGYSASRQIIL